MMWQGCCSIDWLVSDSRQQGNQWPSHSWRTVDIRTSLQTCLQIDHIGSVLFILQSETSLPCSFPGLGPTGIVQCPIRRPSAIMQASISCASVIGYSTPLSWSAIRYMDLAPVEGELAL